MSHQPVLLTLPPQTSAFLDSLEASIDFEVTPACAVLPNAGAAAARELVNRVSSIRDALAVAEAGARLRQLAEHFPGVAGLLEISSDHEYNDQGGTYRTWHASFTFEEDPSSADVDSQAALACPGASSGDLREGGEGTRLTNAEPETLASLYGDEVQEWLDDLAADLHFAAAIVLRRDEDDDLSILIDPLLCARTDLSVRELFEQSCQAGMERMFAAQDLRVGLPLGAPAAAVLQGEVLEASHA
jgi:hypothetical protein